MKTKILLLFLLSLSGLGGATESISVVLLPQHEMYYSGWATAQMTHPDYWHASDSVLMSPETIVQRNEQWMKQADLDLWDLRRKDVSHEHVSKGLQAFKPQEGEHYYLNGTPMTEEQLQNMYSKAISRPLPKSIVIKYGLVSKPTNVRALPTTAVVTVNTITSGPQCFDQLQQTCLNPGEGVQIWHSTADRQWLYVRSSNYEGWVETNNIALCTRKQMLDYISSTNFIVTMGISKEIIEGDTISLNAGSRLCSDGDRILWPQRDTRGNLHILPITIAGETHNGYVPYSSANVLRLCFRQLGLPYDWGGKEGRNDCSGLACSVYRCFGFVMPRDGGPQGRLRPTHYEVGKDSIPWSTLQPGSILTTPSHVTIYLGEVEGKQYIIHCTSFELDRTINGQPICGTMVSSIEDTIGRRRSLKSQINNVVELH